MAAKKNAAAQDLRTPKYRQRIVKNLKKAYIRRPKHPARAADAFSGRPFHCDQNVSNCHWRRRASKKSSSHCASAGGNSRR